MKPQAAELERLRADRAAVVRLRGELEKTKDNLQARERALADKAKPENSALPSGPTHTVLIGVGVDGNLSINESPVDLVAIRQQLVGLPLGSQFELRLRMPKPERGVPLENVKRTVEAISTAGKEIAKERGLKMSLRLDSGSN